MPLLHLVASMPHVHRQGQEKTPTHQLLPDLRLTMAPAASTARSTALANTGFRRRVPR